VAVGGLFVATAATYAEVAAAGGAAAAVAAALGIVGGGGGGGDASEVRSWATLCATVDTPAGAAAVGAAVDGTAAAVAALQRLPPVAVTAAQLGAPSAMAAVAAAAGAVPPPPLATVAAAGRPQAGWPFPLPAQRRDSPPHPSGTPTPRTAHRYTHRHAPTIYHRPRIGRQTQRPLRRR